MRSRRERVDDLRVGALGGRHAADDRLDPVELLVVDVGQRVLHLPGAGQHAQQVADRAHLADRQHLLEEVLQRELAGADLRGGFLGLLGVEDLLGLLDEASTSPMPRIRLAIRSGWKTSKSSSFSPVDANMIGTPVISRTDSAAPPRASPSSLVSTTPVKPTPSRNASAVVTASWPIIASRTKSTSSGSTASRIARRLTHQLLVDAEPTGGVDDDDVVLLGLGLGDARRGDRDRVAGGTCACSPPSLDTPGCGANTVDTGAFADDLKLVDRAGTLQVARHQQRRVSLVHAATSRACPPAWSYRNPAGPPA